MKKEKKQTRLKNEQLRETTNKVKKSNNKQLQ